MSRKKVLESGLPTEFLDEVKSHWRSFHQALLASIGSVDTLHTMVQERGYDISLSAFYAEVAAIPEGKGVVQNPVLLTLICKIAGLEANRLFGLPALAGSEVLLKADEHDRIADAVFKRLQKSPFRSQEKSATKGAKTPRASWLARLRTVRDGFHRIAGQMKYGKPLLMDKAEYFIRASIMNFPDTSIFSQPGYYWSFQSFWSTVYSNGIFLPENLLSLNRLATLGIAETIRTLYLLNSVQRVHTVRVIIHAEKHVGFEFQKACDRFLFVQRSLPFPRARSEVDSDVATWNVMKELLTQQVESWGSLLQFQSIPRFNKAWTHNSVLELVEYLRAGKPIEDIHVINDKVLIVTSKLLAGLEATLQSLSNTLLVDYTGEGSGAHDSGLEKSNRFVFTSGAGEEHLTVPAITEDLSVDDGLAVELESNVNAFSNLESATPNGVVSDLWYHNPDAADD